MASSSSPIQPTLDKSKRVHFAPNSRKLCYDSTSPTNRMKSPLPMIELKPLNCAGALYNSPWLSNVDMMKRPPYCHLDYLQQQTNIDCMASLKGEVAVYNLDLEKQLYIHYTTNAWTFKKVVKAHFVSSIGTLRLDKFMFNIPIEDEYESSKCDHACSFDHSWHCLQLECAIEYRVDGRVYWDNNLGQNYIFDIKVSRPDPIQEVIDIAKGEDSGIIKNKTATPIPIPKLRTQKGHYGGSFEPNYNSCRYFDLHDPRKATRRTDIKPASWDCIGSFAKLKTVMSTSFPLRPQLTTRSSVY